MEHVVARQHPQNCVIEHLTHDVLERGGGSREGEGGEGNILALTATTSSLTE